VKKEPDDTTMVAAAALVSGVLVAGETTENDSLERLLLCILPTARDEGLDSYREFAVELCNSLIDLLEASPEGRGLRAEVGRAMAQEAADSHRDAVICMDQAKKLIKAREPKEALKEPMKEMTNIVSEMDAFEMMSRALLSESKMVLRRAVRAIRSPAPMLAEVLVPQHSCQCEACKDKGEDDEFAH